MKQLIWKLPDLLKAHEITPYQLEMKLRAGLALEAELLEQKSKGAAEGGAKAPRPVGYSPNTIYNWCKLSVVPERLQTATLERILRALEQMTGKELTLNDVLAWEEGAE